MEKSIYKTIFLKLKTNNDKRFIKKISFRKNKNININNEYLNCKIQNKFEKNDYNKGNLGQNDFKNKINRNNKISFSQFMNNSFLSNKKIIFDNTLINQRLKNEQNWNVMKVHNHNISLNLEETRNDKINNRQIVSLRKKDPLIKNKSVINNSIYNKQLYKTIYLKDDSTSILKEYANERLSKNPLIKKILLKRYNKEMCKKKSSILLQSVGNNLSFSMRNENIKDVNKNKYYKSKKNEFPTLNIDYKLNLKKNHRKKYLIKKKNNSVELIQNYNLKIKY